MAETPLTSWFRMRRSVLRVTRRSSLTLRARIAGFELPARFTHSIVLVCAASCWYLDSAGTSSIQQAYIGPGAGIALVGSFLAVLLAMLSAIVALVSWPIRMAWRGFRGKRISAQAMTKRVVILGLDGLDPELTERWMEEGLLPYLSKLRSEGTYTRLRTTWPPLSPVAWSSFSTGVNPGKHNIFDFLARTADYGPQISSVRIRQPRRTLTLGKYRLPLSRPEITSLRKSNPFWKVLSEAGIESAVLRVPISFPPDRFRGVQLSAMCVPDLRGTQGTFSYFSENGETGATTDEELGGERIRVTRQGNTIHATLVGPANPLRTDISGTKLSFQVCHDNGTSTLSIDGQRIPLPLGQYTDWVRVGYPLAPMLKARGLCRFLLKSFEPFELYCTPVHVDPEHPLVPISHPHVYASYLAKRFGPFATLGLAEDTGALSAGLIDEAAFLDQVQNIDRERRNMFFDTLQKVRRGMVVCVFDAPDRIQHMLWKQSELDSANNTIRDLYVSMDALVGETLEKIDSDTTLLVMSDHGFKSFRYGVDLNAWLRENGYLVLKKDAGASDASYLADVDWNRTRAYALGLAGIYINLEGRESQGIVPSGEAYQALVSELCEKLTELKGSQGEMAIHQAVSRETVYHGPYVEGAPDLVVGYNVGYRVAWDAAVGKCGSEVLVENTKAWCGDHCIHPDLVPGVLFSNRSLSSDDPAIIDLAPTTLELLGVDIPAYIDGKSLVCKDANSSS